MSTKFSYKAKWRGAEVLDILESGSDCHVHSLFLHGLNIQVGKRLLYLGDDLRGIVPFGIHLLVSDFARLRQSVTLNTTVFYQDGVLSLGSEKIEVTQAQPYDSYLNKNSIIISRQLEFSNLAGLDFEPIKLFFKSHQMSESSNQERWLKLLLGSGKGLTPSGDDFLVGVLAVQQLQPFLPTKLSDIIVSLLAQGYTTDVSTAYLTSALHHQFSSLVKNVMLQGQAAVPQLSASGATSGVDTLMGINWGLKQAFKER